MRHEGRPSRPTSLEALAAERSIWRKTGVRVAFTNGCFDLLHAGHVALLEAAREAADLLIVALNSDASVRGLKGPDRPVVSDLERAETLLALEAVDRVVLYDDATPARAIGVLLPDVLVKGADWALSDIVGRTTVEAAGGCVLRVEILAGRSTSGLVSHIRFPKAP